MSAETQYSPIIGMGQISTANSNLDGTGTLVSAFTSAGDTFIKTINIKAITNTTQGMVRLFLYDGTNTKLLQEVEIPAVTKSASDPAFETTIPINFCLKSGWVIKASTEKAETFNVIVETLQWAYYTTSVRSDTTKYFAHNGSKTLSTANSNLDGTGTLGALITAVSPGTIIKSINIKALQNTTDGMVRIFLDNAAGTVRLFREIRVPAVTKSATAPSFHHKLNFPDGLFLKPGYVLQGSTEKAETFKVVSESVDLSYPA